MDNTDKVDEFIHDCRDLGLEVLPPDINRSRHAFTVVDDTTILYGLGALKGVGHAAIDMIEAERAEQGAFTDLSDFCNRSDHHKVNKRALEVLLRSGAMDPLDPDRNRARMLRELPEAMQAAEQYQRDLEAGQVDLFGGGGEIRAPQPRDHADVRPWTPLQTLQAERQALGLYLTGHPVALQADELARFSGAVIDPPRAGAEAQTRAIAEARRPESHEAGHPFGEGTAGEKIARILSSESS